MASAAQQIPVPTRVRSVLSRLRWQIRAYVLLEGLALAACWLGITFWAAFACDYLPILVGATELPRTVRGLILGGVLLVFLVIIQRWVVRRLAAPLTDRSLAMVLERRFDQFRDGLVTTVELLGRPLDVPVNAELLSATSRTALLNIGQVRLRQVFHYRPLLAKLATAALFFGSLTVFYLVNQATFLLAANRLWRLNDSPWPRSARIEVVGVEVIRNTSSSTNSTPISQLIPFINGEVKVAKGTNLNLRVRADGSARVVPEYCSIQYQSSLGDRGRVQMKRVGQIHTEQVGEQKLSVQNFTLDGKPFKSILTDIRFDVIGYDHRLPNFLVQVVESPTLTDTVLDCILPAYLVDNDSVASTRKIEYLPSGTQVPLGSQVYLRSRANKPLNRVIVASPETNQNTLLEGPFTEDGYGLQIDLGLLKANQTLELTLVDTDQVTSERPIRIAIAVIPDEVPRVDIRLRGISSAVTPDVNIPVQGKITDDYRVRRTWLDLQINDRESAATSLVPGAAGAIDTAIDFRKLRQADGRIELKPKDKLSLRVFAEDSCALDSGPNQGVSDAYQLNVVTPSELLTMLEARELALRRRFEQVLEELTEMRDSLLRVKLESVDGPIAGRDPSDNRAATNDDSIPDDRSEADRTKSLRILRIQKAVQQCQKSSQEVLGVAVSFADIRDEMLNNRLEVTDRIDQLRDKIVEPLRQSVDQDFVQLQKLLAELETLAPRLEMPTQVDPSLQSTEALIAKLSDILQNMLDIETYNELLDIVRGLIKEQDELIKKTKDQKKKQLLELTQ